MIYLDNSATTKPYEEVLTSFQQVAKEYYANPSSIHMAGGQTEQLLIKARQQVANLLHVRSSELLFTSGGTESNNLAIKGIAFEHYQRGKHIITTEIEHPSVYDTCKSLEEIGFDVTYLPVNERGVVSSVDVENAIREDTILISIMHVNNEIGSVQPIAEIGKIAQAHPKLYFHVDNVQGLGKVPLNMKESKIDLCTMSGHKIHGLKGTGILYIKKGTSLFPLLHGGGQENGIRPGTENVAGIVALAKALRISLDKMEMSIPYIAELKSFLQKELESIEGVKLNTPTEGAPHILNFSVMGMKPEVMIHALEEEGVVLSTKSACSSKKEDTSRIVLACGFEKSRASSALRVSMSYDTTKEEIIFFIKVLTKKIKNLTEVMR